MLVMKNKEQTTLIDRFALAFAGALITFITGSIVWITVNAFLFSATETILFPFSLVLFFTAFGTVLGFFAQHNYLLKILAPIWNLLSSTVKNKDDY